MTGVRAVPLLLACILVAAPAIAQTGVRWGYVVEPETTSVGKPATLTLRVRAPAGTRLTFPQAIDSTSSIEPLDPVSVREETNDGAVTATATYRFLTWELGTVEIPVGIVRVARDQRVQELVIPPPTIVVSTVLPVDTAQRKPRDARDIVLLPGGAWPWWIYALAGFLLLVVGGWLLQRRSRKRVIPVPPFADAQRAFGRLSALDLIGAGEPGKHVTASVEVLRRFLAARDHRANVSLTGAELTAVVRADASVPTARVSSLMGRADAAKFAPDDVDATMAEALGAEAVAIVTEIERADERRGKRK
ncbi:MAG TPA: DUF4381 family protein [Gemmatimonadaceae bacterium]|nr:DUF4381 family protein [Gemmatimonadaceae bacterium]